jgi:hypothetical protein
MRAGARTLYRACPSSIKVPAETTMFLVSRFSASDLCWETFRKSENSVSKHELRAPSGMREKPKPSVAARWGLSKNGTASVHGPRQADQLLETSFPHERS